MAFPIIVVKENPGTLLVEVLRDNEDGRRPERLATVRLPAFGAFTIAGTRAKVSSSVHVDPDETPEDGKHYRLEIRKRSRARGKPSGKRAARRKGQRKTGKTPKRG